MSIYVGSVSYGNQLSMETMETPSRILDAHPMDRKRAETFLLITPPIPPPSIWFRPCRLLRSVIPVRPFPAKSRVPSPSQTTHPPHHLTARPVPARRTRRRLPLVGALARRFIIKEYLHHQRGSSLGSRRRKAWETRESKL